jgi:hypothetical protein
LRHTGDGEDVSEARWFSLPEVQNLNLTPFAHKLFKQAETMRDVATTTSLSPEMFSLNQNFNHQIDQKVSDEVESQL